MKRTVKKQFWLSREEAEALQKNAEAAISPKNNLFILYFDLVFVNNAKINEKCEFANFMRCLGFLF